MDEPKKEQESGLNIVNTISLIVVFGYLSFMPLWMFYPPKVTAETLAILNQMMGAWGYAFAAVIGFHIGSSKGAKEAAQTTRDTVATLTSTVATTAATAATVAATASGTGTGAPVVPPANGADEIKTWNEAAAANTREAFEAYLAKYPNGVRAPDAKTRIAALT
jgi:dolichol kinase